MFVEYRLAPKHPFPNGFDDCYEALQWTYDNAELLNINKEKIAVGGDSAGGAMAVSVAQSARDENTIHLCGQLLVYPVVDKDCKTNSVTHYIDTPLWNGKSNRIMWAMYLKSFPGKETPEYAPPIHGTLTQLPTIYIETAEFDPLHDEGKNYAQQLQISGTDVTLNETLGTIHGYDLMEKSTLKTKP